MTYIESLFKEELGILLVSPKSYKEIGLHAYIYKQLVPTLARKLFKHDQKSKEIDSDVIRELIKTTYKPRAKSFIIKKFHQNYDKLLNTNFYKYLNTEATYSEIKYLSYFLPKNVTPKRRKTRVVMSIQDKLEFEYVRNTSIFTKYINGKRQKRNDGYDQLCQWCKKIKLKFNYVKVVHVGRENIFVCSKKCADAARNYWMRHGHLKQ